MSRGSTSKESKSKHKSKKDDASPGAKSHKSKKDDASPGAKSRKSKKDDGAKSHKSKKDDTSPGDVELVTDHETRQVFRDLLNQAGDVGRPGIDTPYDTRQHDKLKLAHVWQLHNPKLWDEFEEDQRRVQRELQTVEEYGVQLNNWKDETNTFLSEFTIKVGRDEKAREKIQNEAPPEHQLPAPENEKKRSKMFYTLIQRLLDISKKEESKEHREMKKIDMNEMFLLHGTKPFAVPLIAEGGLDPARTTYGTFGLGTYLSDDPGKVDQYCGIDIGDNKDIEDSFYKPFYKKFKVPKPTKKEPLQYFFVLKVTLGQYEIIGKPQEKPVFPMRNPVTKMLIKPEITSHSRIVSSPYFFRFSEYVIFEKPRMVPAYLVAVQRKTSPELKKQIIQDEKDKALEAAEIDKGAETA